MARFRYLFLIPVVFLLLTAAGSFVYGASIFIDSVTTDATPTRRTGDRLGIFLVILDAFLVGATLVVVAVGLYELFVVRRQGSGNPLLPNWLRMRDLEDLKARVISMLILVSAITFVDVLVAAEGGWRADLFTGLAVAVMVVALTIFLRYGRTQTMDRAEDQDQDQDQGGSGG